MIQTLQNWSKGIRLYIALASVLLSVIVVWWANAAYGGTTLYPTRVEETFAWFAISLITLAISIGPFFKLFPKVPGLQVWFDARRLIGVSAAWFATLHGSIAYFGQFGAANPLSLPRNYQIAFLIGGIATVILLAMAFTSFDAAFKHMGIWWFRLHRFVYVAVLLALLHAFMIGVHAAHTVALVVAIVLAVAILLLHSMVAIKRHHISKWQLMTLLSASIALSLIINYGLSQHFMNGISR